MSLKKKRKLNLTRDFDSVEACLALLNLLESIKLHSVADVAADLQYTRDNDFCEMCDSHLDDACGCNDDNNGRYMREYDDGADFED